MWFLLHPSLQIEFNFIVGFCFLLGPLWVDWTDENRLAPGQDYRRGVAVPPNAYTVMFLLPQRRCADAPFHGDRSFYPIDLFVLNKRLAVFGLQEAALMVRFSVRKSLNKPPWESQKNADHNFSRRRCSLRMISTSVRPSLSDLLQSYSWVLESVSSPNCAMSLIRIWAGFTFSLVRNLIVMPYATAEGTTCSRIAIIGTHP